MVSFKGTSKFGRIVLRNLYLHPAGELAQLARALAWHARGHRFDSVILHCFKPPLAAFLLSLEKQVFMSRFSIDSNIARAKTLDTDYYTSAVHYEASKEKIFAQSWQYIGDSDMVQDNGSAHPLTLLEHYINEPLLLTRDKESKLHCMSNVCTHRGNLMVYEPCKLNQLRCKYHGRQFSLDGKFMTMPEFKEFPY
jgi:nitrite reductase/ring-hydroxylating ferredoxin subunit